MGGVAVKKLLLYSLAFVLALPSLILAETPSGFIDYKVKKVTGDASYRDVVVDNETGTHRFDLMTPHGLLMPIHAEAGFTADPDIALVAYKLESVERLPPPQSFDLTDPNGSFSVVTIEADFVLVPAAVSNFGITVPRAPTDNDVDGYTCYTASASDGGPSNGDIVLGDAFSSESRLFNRKGFSHLCLPSRIGGSIIYRPREALTCYSTKVAKGEPAHQSRPVSVSHALGSHQLETKKEQRVCFPATVAGGFAWYSTIVVDGVLDEWPDGTRFPTDGGQNYISWDEDNIYIGLQHSALVDPTDDLMVMAFFGNGNTGLQTTMELGDKTSYLAVPMSHALRYQPSHDSLELLVAYQERGWFTQEAGPVAMAATDPTNVGSVELAIARDLLSLDQALYIHMSLVSTRSGATQSFGSTPYAGPADGYPAAGSIYKSVINIDVTGWLAPNGSPSVDFTDWPIIEVDPPLPNIGDSLRIMTFNGAYLDIPHWETDLSNYILSICSIASTSSTFLSLAFVPAGFVIVVPDGFTFLAICNAVAHQAMGIMNDNFERERGGNLSHVQRARKLAERIQEMDLDVFALNEIFVEDAREELIRILKKEYKYIVARIEPPADTNLGDIFEPHFGAYFIQDSGLMLFSRYPFLPLSNTSLLTPDSEIDLYVNGQLTLNSLHSAVSFVEYKFDCRGEDCLAGKGAALVRIEKNPQQRFAVAFSHMQASYGDDEAAEQQSSMDIRSAQLNKIQQLINGSLTPLEKTTDEVYVLGDLNVVGRHPDGEIMTPAGWPGWDTDDSGASITPVKNKDWDLGRQEWLHHFCGIRTGAPNDPCLNAHPSAYLGAPSMPGFFACGDGTAGLCPDQSEQLFLVDSWGFDTSPHDLGKSQGRGAFSTTNGHCSVEKKFLIRFCAGERLDYILHNKPVDAGAREEGLCAQHMSIAYELNGAGGQQPISDHLPVRGDFNRWWQHCRPREAKEVGETALGNDNTFTSSGAEVKFPGSMQWYLITEPGSYSIGVNPRSDFTFDVYDHEDLSRPRPSFHELETDWGIRYQLPNPPYYVRVFASPDGGESADREKTGSYMITIHRHDCTSALDACTLMAGGLTQAVWPDEEFTTWNQADPHYADRPDTQWYIFKNYADDKGLTPNLSFEYEAQCLDNYTYETVEYCKNGKGPCPGDLHAVVVGENGFDNWLTEACENCSFASDERRVETSRVPAPSLGQEFFLRVLRAEPLGPSCGMCVKQNGMCQTPKPERTAEVRYGTDLTFFYPNNLLLELSEDDFGGDVTDELWYFLDVNSPSTTETCDGCIDPFDPNSDYQFLGEPVEGGEKLGVGHMGVRSFVEQLQTNLYSEAKPNDYDSDEEFFVPRNGPHACAGGLLFGICPLDEGRTNTPDSELEPYYWHSDDPAGNEEEADYKSVLYYCLTHEPVTTKKGQSPLDACQKWTGDSWSE